MSSCNRTTTISPLVVEKGCHILEAEKRDATAVQWKSKSSLGGELLKQKAKAKVHLSHTLNNGIINAHARQAHESI